MIEFSAIFVSTTSFAEVTMALTTFSCNDSPFGGISEETYKLSDFFPSFLSPPLLLHFNVEMF